MPEQDDQKPVIQNHQETMNMYDHWIEKYYQSFSTIPPIAIKHVDYAVVGLAILSKLESLEQNPREIELLTFTLVALDKAETMINSAVDHPAYGPLYYIRGEVYSMRSYKEYQINDYDQAFDDAKQAISDLNKAAAYYQMQPSFPQDLMIDYYKANALHTIAKIYSEKTDLMQALKSYQEAQSAYEQCNMINNLPDFDFQLGTLEVDVGLLYRKSGDNTQALKHYNLALRHFTESTHKQFAPSLIYTNRGTTHMNIASIYMEEKENEGINEYQKAIDDFTIAIQFNQYIAKNYFMRAKAHREIRSMDKALMDYQQAVQHAPQNTLYRLTLARYLGQLGLNEQAFDQYAILLKQAPHRRDLWEEVIRIIAEIHAIDTENQAVEKQSEKIAKEFALVADIMWMCELPEHPGEDQLYYGLRDEIYDALTYHLLIAKGQAPPPETYVHRLAKYVTFAGPLLIPDTLTSGIASALLEKASGDVLHSVDRWSRHKSQQVVAALNHMEGEEKSIEEKIEEIAKNVSEQLTQEYGYSVELLKLNKLGLTALVSTMVERMILGIANYPELLQEIEDGRINPVDACIKCVKEGETNYPVRSLDAVMYDARDIIAGLYAEE